MVSLRDVANRAGVSISTVSIALNKPARVAPGTRQRVEEAVAATGYTPNAIARSLRLGRTNLIGLVVADITNPFFAVLAKIIQSEALAAGYNLVLCNSDEDPERELGFLEILRVQRVAGIIVSPTGHGEAYRARLDAFEHLPVVTVDRRIDGLARDFVGLDSRGAGLALTEYLLRLGHRRIAFIGGPQGVASANERFAGFCAAMAHAGACPDPVLCRHGDFREETALRIARDLLLGHDRPTAIIAANNLMLVGVLHAIGDLGFACPSDISLAGIDEVPLSAVLRPRLTAAAQPIEEIGRQAVAAMLARVDAPVTKLPPRTVLLPPNLKIGGSCRDLRVGRSGRGRVQGATPADG